MLLRNINICVPRPPLREPSLYTHHPRGEILRSERSRSIRKSEVVQKQLEGLVFYQARDSLLSKTDEVKIAAQKVDKAKTSTHNCDRYTEALEANLDHITNGQLDSMASLIMHPCSYIPYFYR